MSAVAVDRQTLGMDEHGDFGADCDFCSFRARAESMDEAALALIWHHFEEHPGEPCVLARVRPDLLEAADLNDVEEG